MKFKTDEIEAQWNSDKVSKKLKDIIKMGEEYSSIEFGQELTITDLIRTQEEQDRIYGDSENYQINPWPSVHQFGRGADLRVRDFTKEQIDKLTTFFNLITYDSNRSNKKTCLVHNVGQGLHFHIQIKA